jgi:hypothetical protein
MKEEWIDKCALNQRPHTRISRGRIQMRGSQQFSWELEQARGIDREEEEEEGGEEEEEGGGGEV